MRTANKYDALAFSGFIIILFSECCIISNSITQAAAIPQKTGDRTQNSHVVYERYVRRRPPTYPGEDEDVFEVREIHYVPYTLFRSNHGVPKHILKYKLNDDEMDRKIRCDFEPTMPECKTSTRAPKHEIIATTTTKSTTKVPTIIAKTTMRTTTTTEKSTTTAAPTTTTTTAATTRTTTTTTTEKSSTTDAPKTTTTTDLPLLPELEFTSEEKIATDAENVVIGDLDDDVEDNENTTDYIEENEVNDTDNDTDDFGNGDEDEDDDDDELVDVNAEYKDEDVGAMGYLDTSVIKNNNK